MDDKPFACPMSGCGMKFVNEDHLEVHKKKHDLSLTLTPSCIRNPFCDETPTPSRILSTLDPELFQELQSDNPFDATFRRANSLGTGSHKLSIPEASNYISSLPDTDTLNTPSITLINDIDTPTIFKHVLALTKKDSPILESVDGTEDSKPSKTFSTGCVDASILQPSLVVDCELQEDNENTSHSGEQADYQLMIEEAELEVPKSSELVSDLSKGKVLLTEPHIQYIPSTVAQTPVITSVGCISKSSPVGGSTTCVPTAVVTRTATNVISSISSNISIVPVVKSDTSGHQKHIVPCQPVIEAACPQPPVVQLVIQIGDGQTMPVRLPITIAPTFVSTNSQPIQSVASISSKPNTSKTPVKMRLKERLAMSKKQAAPRAESSLVMATPESVLQNGLMMMPQSMKQETRNGGSSSRNKPNSRSSIPGRRKEIVVDPNEKRQKSLERNRAAATRCRLRKKQWILNVERKAEDLAGTNAQLQNEVTLLRNEVAQLKTMLLAHKDCPVTQQQKASGFATVISGPSEIRVTSTQTASVSNGISPDFVELMDIVTGSSNSTWESQE